ncbi:MAG: sterol desaturase/sphingolipid hydroxylase (fatty acid hydroxylase superfamily) [Planctomycetota bacterium]|jgi:sterol desaturase/sphingolipid hydroxylase (fatty acid hydroxylase superfamily)
MNSDSELITFALEHEATIRLVIFGAIFLLMMFWEIVAARRSLSISKLVRWRSNLGLLVINSLLLRLFFPAAAVGLSLTVAEQGWGLFNNIELAGWAEILIAIVLLDLAIYAQHVIMHRVPLLWRLHRVHHADLDFDLTTGLRFHSIEILFSMLLKWLVIILIGPAAFAVLVFEIVLNGMAVFNHANAKLPIKLDSVLRRLIVTPDMHRVHHSVIVDETNSNYGFNLSIWDRLFRTYRDQPARGHDAMVIGLAEFRDAQQVSLLRGILMLPFDKRR